MYTFNPLKLQFSHKVCVYTWKLYLSAKLCKWYLEMVCFRTLPIMCFHDCFALFLLIIYIYYITDFYNSNPYSNLSLEGELLRFCEEQTAESVAPSRLVEILQRVLRWSGIQSHEHNDSTTRASALCSSGNWFHIIYIVFTKFLPEDCGELILFLLTIFETKFRLLYNCSKTFLGTTVPWLFTKYPLVFIATCIIIISIFSILIIMRKLRIHRQNHNIVAHSQPSSNSLMHLSPFHYNDSVNAIRSSLAERNVSVPSHQFHPQQINNWGLAFFLRWMFVVLVLSLILSIPWEFLRLYHKARASRAADVLKVGMLFFHSKIGAGFYYFWLTNHSYQYQ